MSTIRDSAATRPAPGGFDSVPPTLLVCFRLSGGTLGMPSRSIVFPLLAFAAVSQGCKSTPAALEAPPFVSATVPGEFDATWESTRDVLLERGLQIYVRDKRGMFVAYTPTKRRLIFFPRRTKLTVTLEPASDAETTVSVETIRQHYRVTLLTYPDWRDVPGSADEAAGQSLLDAIVAHSKREEANPGPEA